MPRPKEPLKVIYGKSKSNHITKAEAKKREKQEEKARGPVEDIIAPSYLKPAQKKEFYSIADKLVPLGIFSELDVDTLARYLDSKHQYLQIIKHIRKMEPIEEVETENGDFIKVASESYKKLTKTKNDLFNECRASAADLGLTLSSRLKLVLPGEDDNQQQTEAEKRFSGRL